MHLGTTARRRNDEVKRLNDLYVQSVPLKHTLQKCLKYLAQTEPYRMLKDWTYDMSTDPIEEDATSGPPDFTDVSITFRKITT